MGIADDITYFALVVFTIVFGKVFKSYNGNQKLLGLFLGLLISLLVSGSHVYHVIVIILFNAFLITFLRRSCHIWSTTFTFTYLVFFRCSTYFGLEKSPSFTNAIMMMLTLKMVGVAFEVHDTNQRRRAIVKASEQTNKEEMTKLELESKYWDVNPTFLDVIFYGFCYIGILTGPYYKFRVWEDAIERKKYANIPTLKSAVHRVSIVPLFLILFLILSYFFPLSYVSKEEFFTERSVLFRIWYLFPLFSTFRMRLYSAFIMSEAACISAGLGAYPQQSQPKYGAGPTNLEIMENLDKEDAISEEKDLCFKTIQNVDAWLGEVTNTVRASMRVWNTTVQYWLAINVHRRFPIKPLRILVTMFVSAFWHGLYPGYYLALCSAAVAVFCEDVFIKKLKSRVSISISSGESKFD
ncbi:hypothetical protein QYM36_007967 [Artemia franciscana]|uniref:Lysophospholipid acyltransferase 7 n=1 Tax=Artemia franciscana TaxID=6661 RepID=A0AA88IFS0_ARTSF|nr:hypothetical protein QYM36_007967 [Artemia franciscana]